MTMTVDQMVHVLRCIACDAEAGRVPSPSQLKACAEISTTLLILSDFATKVTLAEMRALAPQSDLAKESKR